MNKGRSMDFEHLTQVMRRLALEAGDKIMEIYESGDLGVEAKADDSPVTRADVAADRIIHDGLKAAFADVQIVTEERAATHGGARQDRFILVDPLDGTKEFVKRGGDFTVNIALIENGVPVAGVVYAPAKGRLFQTLDAGGVVEETGALTLDAIGPRKPLPLRARSRRRQPAMHSTCRLSSANNR